MKVNFFVNTRANTKSVVYSMKETVAHDVWYTSLASP